MAKDNAQNIEDYKSSPIGMIPKDWDIFSVQELLDRKFITSHLDGNHGALYPKSEEFVDHGVPYIAANSFESGKVNFSKCKFLTQERANTFRKGVAKNGDVLFAHNATVGPVALLETDLEYVILSTTATYFRCNNSKLNNNYLLSYFQSPYFISQYEKVMGQTTRNQVPITIQRKFQIIFPPLSEQRKIAQVLSTWDESIKTLENLISRKERHKKAMMQQLFTGKKRFKEFKGEKWKDKLLGECVVGKGEYGINAASVPFSQVLPRYLRITDIDNYGCYTSINQVSVNDLNYKNYILMSGDIVFARTGNTTGKTYKYNPNDGELVYAGFLIRFKPDPKILNVDFLKHFTETNNYWNWVKIMSSRSGQPGINGTEYSELKLLLPSIAEQKKIVSVLSATDTEMQSLKTQLEHYKQQKKGLMQVLLTGKTRVKV